MQFVLTIATLTFMVNYFAFAFNFVSNTNNTCDEKSVCIRKCCPESFVLINKKCVLENTTIFNPGIYQRKEKVDKNAFKINVISANFCNVEERRFLTKETNEKIYLQTNGFLLRIFKDANLKNQYVPWNKYCLEQNLVNANSTTWVAIVCKNNKDVQNFERWHIYGMIISMPFLLVTFLAYAILPDRNLHQRALMFYVLTLLISYILLVTINLSENLSEPWCALFGYFTLYFFMVSFFWMNVICFDIWYTFSGGRGFVGSKRTSERKRLLLYSLYAFGVPLLLVLLVLLLQTKVLSEESVHNPGIGVNKCFVADGWPNLWYFYLEAGILVIANIIFFVLTALKIRQAKKETSMLKHTDSKRHSYEKDEQIFNLYVKLLFAMGVNWSMEVISWLVNWSTNYNEKVQYIWWVTDFFNACYGVFIFFMFVFKKKIWRLLQRRYYNFIGKPHLAHTMTTTIATGTSHYSSTNYSTADTAITDRSNVSNGNGRTRPEQVALRSVS